MTNFCNLKALKVQNLLPKAPIITEIIWQPSPLSWVKCNSHGASKGNPDTSACGGIFRENQVNLDYFSSNLGVLVTIFFIELNCVFITTIQIAHNRGWDNL
jgi:hypothetical protein